MSLNNYVSLFKNLFVSICKFVHFTFALLGSEVKMFDTTNSGLTAQEE